VLDRNRTAGAAQSEKSTVVADDREADARARRRVGGEVIGYVGSSESPGMPHLHFELLKNEESVNPYIFLNRKTKS